MVGSMSTGVPKLPLAAPVQAPLLRDARVHVGQNQGDQDEDMHRGQYLGRAKT